ncbi:MAG: 6-phosphogluconolactonase [Planctomycetes bacterium RBG_13_46_10]|nr:MAG: 6-phosphogluconolactonase [Planctomycetes bacterium RBG_13_46_10]
METAAQYKPNVEVVPDSESLARRSTDIFIADAQKAIKAKGVFYVAISGGHTPKRFFELLGNEPSARSLPWDKIHAFWVDERYVPPDSQWSNYKLAADTFLAKVTIPQDNIHRIPTEYCDVNMAAHLYEDEIRSVFGLKENEVPQFDLIVLGMGTEGHTGSLFPASYASFDMEHLVSVVYAMDEKLNRITLTHPVLCAAAHLAVLVSGKEKADILKNVLTSEPDEVHYPIHVLWPVLYKVTWLVDDDAAKNIRH